MRVLILLVYVVTLCELCVECGRNKHKKIHLRIHVPKLVKHHHHTKLVVFHKPRRHGHIFRKHPITKPRLHNHINHYQKLEALRCTELDCFPPETVQVKKQEIVHRHHIHHYHHDDDVPPLPPNPPKYQKIVEKNYHRHHYGSHNINQHNSNYLKEELPTDVLLGYDKNAHKSLRSERVEIETFDDNPDFSSGYKVKEEDKPNENYESLEDFGGGNYGDDVELVDDYKTGNGKYLGIFVDRSLDDHEGFEDT